MVLREDAALSPRGTLPNRQGASRALRAHITPWMGRAPRAAGPGEFIQQDMGPCPPLLVNAHEANGFLSVQVGNYTSNYLGSVDISS